MLTGPSVEHAVSWPHQTAWRGHDRRT
jgi:hypothetical protein